MCVLEFKRLIDIHSLCGVGSNHISRCIFGSVGNDLVLWMEGGEGFFGIEIGAMAFCEFLSSAICAGFLS